jgi:hypothetical protein
MLDVTGWGSPSAPVPALGSSPDQIVLADALGGANDLKLGDLIDRVDVIDALEAIEVRSGSD